MDAVKIKLTPAQTSVWAGILNDGRYQLAPATFRTRYVPSPQLNVP